MASTEISNSTKLTVKDSPDNTESAMGGRCTCMCNMSVCMRVCAISRSYLLNAVDITHSPLERREEFVMRKVRKIMKPASFFYHL